MEPAWLQEMATEHYLALGKAVHAWAKIEATLYDYLREYAPSPQVYEWVTARHRPIPERCEALLAFLEAEIGAGADLTEVKDCLKAIKVLAGRRNKIAHNPMLYWIENDGAAPQIVQRIVSGQDGTDTKLDLGALREFEAEADGARTGLMLAVARLKRPKFPT